MPLITEDRTGQPRSDEEIAEALLQVKREIAKADFSNPMLFVQFLTIKDGLEELLSLRQKIRKAVKDAVQRQM